MGLSPAGEKPGAYRLADARFWPRLRSADDGLYRYPPPRDQEVVFAAGAVKSAFVLIFYKQINKRSGLDNLFGCDEDLARRFFRWDPFTDAACSRALHVIL